MIIQKVTSISAIFVILFSAIKAQDKLYPNEFPLGDVVLLEGPFKKAMELNRNHLLKYTVDRLLYCYRKEAGLSTLGASNYTNWAGLDGHVGGHYLSALSMQYAATGDTECKKRLDYMIAELKKCQDANGNDADFVGYLCGIPNGKPMWRSVKNGNPGAVNDYWVPWYNIHKTYAGLRDAWLYGNITEAKTMFLKLCDWGINICSRLSDSQMQSMLGQEHGGINEMYADAYQITGNQKYLDFAKRFSHRWLLDAMAAGRDNLDGAHANTQVPKAIGFQRIGELGKDNTYYNAAEFFWTTVTSNRSIVIGGNSEDEFFRAKNQWMEYITDRNGVESCNTHNMLKLTEGLFRMKPHAKYVDFYERALFNHILSTQNPEHGGYVYFTPTHPRHYRVYSSPDVCMWCCVGTGMENHTKYGQFIYTHTNDSLFVNLFIASELNWREKGIKIRQETHFPDEEQTLLTINTPSPIKFRLLIRHPYWSAAGEIKIIINADTLDVRSQPTSYIELNRTWNNGDIIKVILPMHFTFEQLNNVPSWVALKRGPIVLGAKTSTNAADMPGLIANADRWAHSPGGTLLDPNSAPKLNIDRGNFESKFIAVSGRPMTFKAPGIFANKADTNLILEPFFRIHNARYMMYWNATITGTTVVENITKKRISPEIRLSKNGINLLFDDFVDSRKIFIYNMSGKKIASLHAEGRNINLNYSEQGRKITNGLYVFQIVCNKGESEKIYLSKNILSF